MSACHRLIFPVWSMKATLRLVVMLAFAGLCAAAQPEYQPTVGEKGKDVIWVPTGQALVNRMLTMAKVTANDYVVDLGSGDGRLVISAAHRGARAHGIEFNLKLVELARRNAEREGVSKRATFEHADVFQSDFSTATVVTLFLLPSLNMKLRPTLLAMKPGTRIVANSFDMGDWKPDREAESRGDCTPWCTGYLWVVPAQVAGLWKSSAGDLNLTQTYQVVKGTLLHDGVTVALAHVKLDGAQLSFSAGGAEFRGSVNADRIAGTLTRAGKTEAWSASRAK